MGALRREPVHQTGDVEAVRAGQNRNAGRDGLKAAGAVVGGHLELLETEHLLTISSGKAGAYPMSAVNFNFAKYNKRDGAHRGHTSFCFFVFWF